MLRIINKSERTHYKVPRSQAISLLESPLRFEFFMSDALTLGRSEPLAWNGDDSTKVFCMDINNRLYNITANGIQKSVEHSCMLSEMFHSFTFPFCKSNVP